MENSRNVNGSSIANSSLSAGIAKWVGARNSYQPDIAGLTLYRWENPTEPTSYVLTPHICLIGQGAKRVSIGESSLVYNPQTFLLSSVELPLVAQILEASPERPYLGLSMELDLQEISTLMAKMSIPPSGAATSSSDFRGISVGNASGELIGAFERLLGLLDTPEDIAIMAPHIKREIYYRIMRSNQGERLRQIVSIGTYGNRIAQALEWLKGNFNKSLRVEDLAKIAGMSPSAFYQYFKSLTSMTPIQFQKRLRLNEARRLMLIEEADAADAAFQVGYESPSQFNRDYRRHFGQPPLRDIKALRSNGAVVAA